MPEFRTRFRSGGRNFALDWSSNQNIGLGLNFGLNNSISVSVFGLNGLASVSISVSRIGPGLGLNDLVSVYRSRSGELGLGFGLYRSQVQAARVRGVVAADVLGDGVGAVVTSAEARPLLGTQAASAVAPVRIRPCQQKTTTQLPQTDPRDCIVL